MSTFEIKMPKLGESITEGTIVSWSVKVGDAVQEDDVLFDQIPNYRPHYKLPRLKKGMALAIEPMVNAGRPSVKILDDGWTCLLYTSSKGTVIVEGARTLKKAVRPTEQNPEGGIQEINGPIHISLSLIHI